MKLKIVLLSMFAGMALLSKAQDVEESNKLDKISVGVKFGANLANMSYSSSLYDAYDHSLMGRGILGICSEFEISDKFSLKPEFLFIGKGVNLTYGDIDYTLKANYLDFRVPVAYTFSTSSSISPYIMMGPTFGFVVGGNIKLGDYKVDVSDKNIRTTDFGAVFGVGAKHEFEVGMSRLIASAEVSYNMGFSNTFSENEINGSADAINASVYDVEGTRKNRGVAITVSLSVPFSSLFKKKQSKATPPPAVSIPEPPKEEPQKEEPVVGTQDKECYPLDEMIDFMTSGKDISDKKICMFDLKFGFNKATIEGTPEMLDKVAVMLQKFPHMIIQVNGHTDNIGSEVFNQNLSEQRAMSVKKYIAQKGVDSKRINTKGFGFLMPLDTNDTEEGQAKNRRVEIEILAVGE